MHPRLVTLAGSLAGAMVGAAIGAPHGVEAMLVGATWGYLGARKARLA